MTAGGTSPVSLTVNQSYARPSRIRINSSTTTTANTTWYVGVDYASPVGELHVAGGQSPSPVLRVSGSQVADALAKDGYDLSYSSRLVGTVCVSPPACPAVGGPMQITAGMVLSMTGHAMSDETWEIVPIVVEREDSHTDNAWYHFGEQRSLVIQKVVVGFQEVVFS